jgi:hypothetical protein
MLCVNLNYGGDLNSNPKDLVYSPEIIDRRLADSKRIENRINCA